MNNFKKDDFRRQPLEYSKEYNSGKSKTIPGLSMSIDVMQKRLAAGLPVQTSSRVVETYFKNLDLVDKQNMVEKYQQAMKKLHEANAIQSQNQNPVNNANNPEKGNE